MKRLKLLIIIFCLALALPLAYVSWRTYAGLAQEELSQLNYFSEAILDKMEQGSGRPDPEQRRAARWTRIIIPWPRKVRRRVLSPLAQKAFPTLYCGLFPEQSGRLLPDAFGGRPP